MNNSRYIIRERYDNLTVMLYSTIYLIVNKDFDQYRKTFLVTLNNFLSAWRELVRTHHWDLHEYDRRLMRVAGRADMLILKYWDISVSLNKGYIECRKQKDSARFEEFIEEMKQAVLEKELTS